MPAFLLVGGGGGGAVRCRGQKDTLISACKTRRREQTDWVGIFGHESIFGAMSLGDFSSLRKRDWLSPIGLGFSTASIGAGCILHFVKDTLLNAVPVGHVVAIKLHDVQDLRGTKSVRSLYQQASGRMIGHTA